MRQVLSGALARSPGKRRRAWARLASFWEAGLPRAPAGDLGMLTGPGVSLARQHDETGGSQLAHDAPDPGRGQVVHRAGQRPGHPHDLPPGAEITCRFMPWRRCLPE